MYKEDNDPYNLLQGDIILDYKNEDLPEYEPKLFYKGILILSYSCDLDSKHIRVSYINICPIYSLEYLIMILFEKFKKECCEQATPQKRSNCIKKNIIKMMEEIIKYDTRLYFFLKPNAIFKNNSEPLVADLQQISYISIDYYDNLLKNKTASLENPWIEKLGYMTGYLFNRVAIDDISKTELKDLLDCNCSPIIENLLLENETEILQYKKE